MAMISNHLSFTYGLYKNTHIMSSGLSLSNVLVLIWLETRETPIDTF